MEEREKLEESKKLSCKNRCSDYDADCHKVPDHAKCFIGGTTIINGVRCHTPIADGYCPFIHKES